MKDGRVFLVGLTTLLVANLMLVGLCSSCEEPPTPPLEAPRATAAPLPPKRIVAFCSLPMFLR